jgi:TPR repeat protein
VHIVKRPILTLLTATLLGLASTAVFAEESPAPAPVPQATQAVEVYDLSQGQAAFNAGNFNQAFKLWKALADQGHHGAEVLVGLAYANGWGVEKDMRTASRWYKKAAEKNNPSGQFLLGLHYVSQREAKTAAGLKWLRKAAANGDDSAQRFLDKANARHWFDDVEEKAPAETETQGPENIISAIPASANPKEQL